MNPTPVNTPADAAERLEQALRAGLSAVDPGPAFTAALQARLVTAQPPAALADGRIMAGSRRLHSASLALAASIVMAIGVGAQLLELHAEQRTAAAHTQLLLALEITSERLGLAQQRIEQFQEQEIKP